MTAVPTNFVRLLILTFFPMFNASFQFQMLAEAVVSSSENSIVQQNRERQPQTFEMNLFLRPKRSEFKAQ